MHGVEADTCVRWWSWSGDASQERTLGHPARCVCGGRRDWPDGAGKWWKAVSFGVLRMWRHA